MAALDAILDRMAARSAEALHLRVGEIPAVIAAGRSVPIKKEPLTEQQWTALVHEVAGPQDMERLALHQPCNFSHRGFVFQVSFDAGVASCVGRPATAGDGAGEPPEPSGLMLDIEPRQPRRTPVAPAEHIDPPSEVGPPAAPVQKPPRAITSGARDLGFFGAHRTGLTIGVVLLIVVIEAVLWWTRPVTIPNLVLNDADGQPVKLSEMRQARSKALVLVFLVANCPISRFAVTTLKQAYPQQSRDLSFAGFYFGTQADAERFRKAEDVPFPVYGLKDAQDPFALQEMTRKVGVSSMLVTGVYGGTVVVIDEENRIILRLEKEGVQKLAEKLAKITDG
jgi:hypothetical protein